MSRPTVVKLLRELARGGWIRLLPHYGSRRKPLLYLRAPIGADPASYRACCLESVINGLRRISPDCRFFWWKTGRVRQIDLVADLEQKRIGFCFAPSPFVRNKDLLSFRRGFQRGLIHRGFLLFRGGYPFLAGRVVGMSLGAFLGNTEQWVQARALTSSLMVLISKGRNDSATECAS